MLTNNIFIMILSVFGLYLDISISIDMTTDNVVAKTAANNIDEDRSFSPKILIV
jgi:hypothetical protein